MTALCYVDEAGSGEIIPADQSPVAPVFVMLGLIIDAPRIHTLTRQFLELKKRFFPGLVRGGPFLGSVLKEVKGKDLRRSVRQGSRDERRATLGFLDNLIEVIKSVDARLVGRVYAKAIGTPSDEKAMYSFSLQDICRHFQRWLIDSSQEGLVICDSRTKTKNTPVAHSIFTQKFKAGGDEYDRLHEMPTFGHSDNHVGLQVADLVASAFLFPIACRAYCTGHLNSVHTSERYDVLIDRYGRALRELQFRYRDGERWTGGIIVSDPVGGRSGAYMFRR
ncbi:MAG: DUF3800 domain-containing protein [Actinomycetota bacterium]